jgi:hypothetical protein
MPADNFEIILDVDGRPRKILRDGHRARVPLMLRDGVNPSLTSLQRAVANRSALSDSELSSCRPGFRYGQRSAADRQAMSDAKAKAYQQYDAEIGRAYLTPEFGGSDPRLTGFGSNGPRQEPPLGAPCTRNGFPGTWARNAAGQMYCDIRSSAGRADAKARLRSRLDPDADEEQEREQQTSVEQAASDHQQRMAQIYDALDEELAEAWRNL